MFKDFHYLNRSVLELNKLLVGSVIFDVYSQEKNKIFFNIGSMDEPYRHLVISTNPQHPYITVKKIHHKAKRNTIRFFSETLPDTIKKVHIAEFDRIIKIKLTNSNIYFIIIGARTNVFHSTSSQEINFFKQNKLNPEKIKSVLSKNYECKLIDKFSFSENISDLKYQTVKQSIPFISKDLYSEIMYRNKSGAVNEFEYHARKCIKEIMKNDIVIGKENRT
ncbi:NFACT family protein, partial [Bacteroidota bacterium]